MKKFKNPYESLKTPANIICCQDRLLTTSVFLGGAEEDTNPEERDSSASSVLIGFWKTSNKHT